MATMWTFGAAFGVAVHFFSNQMRKVPFTHRPWEIPLFAVATGYAFQYYDEVTSRSEVKVNAMLRDRVEQNKDFVTPLPSAPVPPH